MILCFLHVEVVTGTKRGPTHQYDDVHASLTHNSIEHRVLVALRKASLLIQTGSKASTCDQAVRRHNGSRVPAGEPPVVPASRRPRFATKHVRK